MLAPCHGPQSSRGNDCICLTSLCSKRWPATDLTLLTARGSTGAQGFYKGVSLVEKASAFGTTSAGVRTHTGALKRFDNPFLRESGKCCL